MSDIAERWGALEARVAAACARSGRDRSAVTVVAVSKVHPAAAVRAAYVAGARLFGENYVQEWLEKAEHPTLVGLPALRWTFIGRLQRNKVRHLLGRVACIETVDSLRLAEEISRRATERGGGFTQSVLLQINTAGEASKGGFLPDEAQGAIGRLVALPGITLDGLMHIPPARTDRAARSADHRALAALAASLRAATGLPLRELSMGMSGDFEEAIEQGATRVRVGTALFGARSP